MTVEEVGRVDAPANELATQTFPIEDAGSDTLGPFELTADLPPGGDYGVRVHVDRSGDGRIVPGDLVSVAKHSVERGRAEVVLPVREVPSA